jgi:hypothetical protein
LAGSGQANDLALSELSWSIISIVSEKRKQIYIKRGHHSSSVSEMCSKKIILPSLGDVYILLYPLAEAVVRSKQTIVDPLIRHDLSPMI